MAEESSDSDTDDEDKTVHHIAEDSSFTQPEEPSCMTADYLRVNALPQIQQRVMSESRQSVDCGGEVQGGWQLMVWSSGGDRM